MRPLRPSHTWKPDANSVNPASSAPPRRAEVCRYIGPSSRIRQSEVGFAKPIAPPRGSDRRAGIRSSGLRQPGPRRSELSQMDVRHMHLCRRAGLAFAARRRRSGASRRSLSRLPCRDFRPQFYFGHLVQCCLRPVTVRSQHPSGCPIPAIKGRSRGDSNSRLVQIFGHQM